MKRLISRAAIRAALDAKRPVVQRPTSGFYDDMERKWTFHCVWCRKELSISAYVLASQASVEYHCAHCGRVIRVSAKPRWSPTHLYVEEGL